MVNLVLTNHKEKQFSFLHLNEPSVSVDILKRPKIPRGFTKKFHPQYFTLAASSHVPANEKNPFLWFFANVQIESYG